MPLLVTDLASTTSNRQPAGVVFLALTTIISIALAVASHAIAWEVSPALHTVLEIVAAWFALFAGTISLVRHQTREDNLFLFIGIGFLGAGILDGYHAIISAGGISYESPSTLVTLDRWSWFASRFWISVCLCLSWIVWKRGIVRRFVVDMTAYLTTGTLILAAILVLAVAPLPHPQTFRFVVAEPFELIPGVFFVIALAGYWVAGSKKDDLLDQCLVASLAIGLATQICTMLGSDSALNSFDGVAHTLKILSYAVFAVGSLASVFSAFADARRLSAESQLQIAEVDRANEGIEAFVRWASHDLRSPLRHIFSFCGFVRESATERLTETEKEDLQRVMDAATSMSDLLDGLSRFAKLGAASLQFETFSLDDAAKTVIEQLPSEQQACVDCSNLGEITADKALLTIVLQNLIENGLKYVKDRTPAVTVQSQVDPQFVHITVADNGIGIQRSLWERIFEPGVRGVGKSEYSGTGFGLATCSRIIAAHQGKIWVESEVGKGSVFHFTIPFLIEEHRELVAESGPWAIPS